MRKSIISCNVKKFIKSFFIFDFINFIKSFAKQSYINNINTNKAIKLLDFKKLNQLNLLSYKKSDTLFVLGSGASINTLTEQQWQEIKKSDSIGFNFWCIHDFVPNMYVFETPRDKQTALNLFQNFEKKKKHYQNVPSILKDIRTTNLENFFSISNELAKQIYIAFDIEMSIERGKHFEKILRICNYLSKFLFKKGKARLLFKRRASLSLITHLGYLMGYKKIVLCGVDLNNSKYFYEEKRAYYENKGINVPNSGQTGGVHSTIDPEHNEITIDQVLLAVNEVLLRPNGTELYVALNSSALHPRLPSYW